MVCATSFASGNWHGDSSSTLLGKVPIKQFLVMLTRMRTTETINQSLLVCTGHPQATVGVPHTKDEDQKLLWYNANILRRQKNIRYPATREASPLILYYIIGLGPRLCSTDGLWHHHIITTDYEFNHALFADSSAVKRSIPACARPPQTGAKCRTISQSHSDDGQTGWTDDSRVTPLQPWLSPATLTS